MAQAEVYVDPSIAADSGAGTVGDPYGDLQYALTNLATDATDGVRVNVKAGTAEVLSAALTLGFACSVGAPLIIQGYASTAGDGDFAAGTGIAEIDCGGTTGMFNNAALEGVVLQHLEVHNAGSADMIKLDRYGAVIECELHDCTGNAVEYANGAFTAVIGCHFHNLGKYGIVDARRILNNVFIDETNTIQRAISLSIASASVIGNILALNSTGGIGVFATNSDLTIYGNTIFNQAAGTGAGIQASSGDNQVILNNIIEGFSGSGGVGINIDSVDMNQCLGYNYFTNNETDYAGYNTGARGGDLTAGDIVDDSNSAISKSGSLTYANRATYFAPSTHADDEGFQA